MTRKQSRRLSSARAYYRLAVKAQMAGQSRQADVYRKLADRLVSEDRRNREYLRRMKQGR